MYRRLIRLSSTMHGPLRLFLIFTSFSTLYAICFIWKTDITVFSDEKPNEPQTFSYVDKYAKNVKHSFRSSTKKINHSPGWFTPLTISTVTDASRKPSAESKVDELPSKSQIRCRDDSKFRIPNILHYIWVGDNKLPFHQYISMR